MASHQTWPKSWHILRCFFPGFAWSGKKLPLQEDLNVAVVFQHLAENYISKVVMVMVMVVVVVMVMVMVTVVVIVTVVVRMMMMVMVMIVIDSDR